MLETEDLILDKAKLSDWRDMYKNVWSHKESAKYMMWSVADNEVDALVRIQKIMEYQKTHDTYLVYSKQTGEAIGFAGIERLSPFVCRDAGICLGPEYVGKGYGRQILQCLMDYARDRLGIIGFMYYSREDNAASVALANSVGFKPYGKVVKQIDMRDGSFYNLQRFSIAL